MNMNTMMRKKNNSKQSILVINLKTINSMANYKILKGVLSNVGIMGTLKDLPTMIFMHFKPIVVVVI